MLTAAADDDEDEDDNDNNNGRLQHSLEWIMRV